MISSVETIAAVAAMLGINLIGWAFMVGVMWQKINGQEARQKRHEDLPVVRAHAANEG